MDLTRWSVVQIWLDGRLPARELEQGFILRSSAKRYASRISAKNAWLGATYEFRRR